MFIDEECGNLKVVIDGGKLTRNSNQKKNESSHCELFCKNGVLRCAWKFEVFWMALENKSRSVESEDTLAKLGVLLKDVSLPGVLRCSGF